MQKGTSMRRSDKEIRDPSTIESLLREAPVGRLGTCCDGEPYVTPLNFAYEKGRIIFHGASIGKKIENIRKNPRVCFEVDEGDIIPAETPCRFTCRYRSVIAQGTAEIHTDKRIVTEDLRLLACKYAGKDVNQEMTEETLSEFQNLAVVEITIDRITGKKNPP